MKAMVTGANGFLGRAICRAWAAHGEPVKAVYRDSVNRKDIFDHLDIEIVDDTQPNSQKCVGADVVIHCAARTHVLREFPKRPLDEIRRINRDAAVDLARAAAEVGVRRFIFLSSIHVAGDRSLGLPLRETDRPNPQEFYALSKWEAEQSLLECGYASGLEIVILRLPLVHGPNPKGNLRKLLIAIDAEVLLPLGTVENRRSVLGIDNLCSAVWLAANSPNLGGRTYHLADEGSISVREMVLVLASVLGKRPRLIAVPRWLAMAGGLLAGRRDQLRKLLDDLEVDASAFRLATGWRPTVGLRDGLREMAESYARQSNPTTDNLGANAHKPDRA